MICFVGRRYLKKVCFLGLVDLICYVFVFGDIMLFGIVYSYKYNSLITHVKLVTPSNNVVFLHYYTECNGTYFERIKLGIYYTRRVPVD